MKESWHKGDNSMNYFYQVVDTLVLIISCQNNAWC